jgi:membrane peptidoglycan carboxypeptidase
MVETSKAAKIPSLADVSQYITTDELRLSPLQMAVAAAELTNGGNKVTPVLATAFQDPEGNWNLLGKKTDSGTISHFNAKQAVGLLVQGDTSVWSNVAQVKDKEKTISWYVAGTPSDWQGVPFVLVIALEDSTASQTEMLGRQLINNIFIK